MNMTELLAQRQARNGKDPVKQSGNKILTPAPISTGSTSSMDTPESRAVSGLAPCAGHHENGQEGGHVRADLVSKSLKLLKLHKRKIYSSINTIHEASSWKRLDKSNTQTRLLAFQLALRDLKRVGASGVEGRARESRSDSLRTVGDAAPRHIIPFTITLASEVQEKIAKSGITAFGSKLSENLKAKLGYSLPMWLAVEQSGHIHIHGEILASESEFDGAFRAIVHKLAKRGGNRVLVSSEGTRADLTPYLGERLTTLFWGSYSLMDTPNIAGSSLYVSRELNQHARALYPTIRQRLETYLIGYERRQLEETAQAALEDRLSEERAYVASFADHTHEPDDFDPSRIAAKIARLKSLISKPKTSITPDLPNPRPRPKPFMERIAELREQRRIEQEQQRKEWEPYAKMLAEIGNSPLNKPSNSDLQTPKLPVILSAPDNIEIPKNENHKTLSRSFLEPPCRDAPATRTRQVRAGPMAQPIRSP